MGYWIIDGKEMTDAEYEEYKRQEELAKERIRREAATLMNRLGARSASQRHTKLLPIATGGTSATGNSGVF